MRPIQLLSGTPTTVGTTTATYTVTDAIGTSAALTFTIEVTEDGYGPGPDPLDVNGDGQVNVLDLCAGRSLLRETRGQPA